jgi:hypothetical protein
VSSRSLMPVIDLLERGLSKSQEDALRKDLDEMGIKGPLIYREVSSKISTIGSQTIRGTKYEKMDTRKKRKLLDTEMNFVPPPYLCF